MKERKIFNGKEVEIRTLSEKDLKLAEEFLDFYNSLIEEETQITSCKKKNLKEENKWLRKELNEIKKRKKVVIIVGEDSGKIIGYCDVGLLPERFSQVGEFGVTIRKGYRGIGLGSYLTKKILKLVRKKLKPRSIRLTVFPTNKIAISLYKKFGFKIVAKIPKQISYKGKLIDQIIMLKQL